MILIGIATVLLASCAPRYATCPTYAKKEFKAKQVTEEPALARRP